MGLAGTAAKLLASLDLDTKAFEAGAKRVEGRLGKMQGAFGKLGKAALIGVGAAVAGGAAIIGRSVKSGLESLADLEDAVTAVGGAIEQKGLTKAIKPGEIAKWANEIEAATEAAFDDKDIIKATETLIRYGNVGPTNLRQTMEVMTDLAARTGSVESAATQLAKALADPTEAASKLSRSGVVLNEAQEKQLKSFAGLTKEQKKQFDQLAKEDKKAANRFKKQALAANQIEAQKFLLDALAKSTTGAAKASAGPYRDSLNILRDTVEDAQRALAEGFLPVIMKVRDILTRELGKPETIEKLRDFGRSLAGGLDKLIDLATGLPWGAIGDAFKLMGTGSKALFDAFTSLPPWVQTAVLTAWGTNKITGGLIGELGKGLIKGVLGMTAGVVNINAATVNGAGGPAAGGRAGLGVGGAIAAGTGIGAAAAVAVNDVPVIAEGFARGYEAAQKGDMEGVLTAQRDIVAGVWALPAPIRDLLTGIVDTKTTLERGIPVKPQGMSPDERQEAADQRRKLADLAEKSSRSITAAERIKGAVDWNRQATASRLDQVTAAIRAGFGGMRVTVPIYINGVRQTNLQQRTFLNRVGRNAEL